MYVLELYCASGGSSCLSTGSGRWSPRRCCRPVSSRASYLKMLFWTLTAESRSIGHDGEEIFRAYTSLAPVSPWNQHICIMGCPGASLTQRTPCGRSQTLLALLPDWLLFVQLSKPMQFAARYAMLHISWTRGGERRVYIRMIIHKRDWERREAWAFFIDRNWMPWASNVPVNL
jgi:hypothetical protein